LEVLEDETSVRVNRAESPEDKDKELARFRTTVDYLKTHAGDSPPPDYLAMSTWSGPSGNRPADTRLPAGNVAAIGRSLFSDYVLGVELAGTLLLVATIGAIAITRRSSMRAAT
jgi:hypothetical protein